MRNVARDPASRSEAFVRASVRDRNVVEPTCRYSWANMTASTLWSLPVRKRVQNERIEEGEAISHCSAYISSLEKVSRNRVIGIVTWGESIG
jgi:hypothetical protein